MKRWLELPETVAEVCQVLRVLPRVEHARRTRGPRPVLDELRRQSQSAPARDATARRCLRRAIRWVDACMTDGGNCYRRALLEIALDRRAASTPLVLGFSRQDGGITGHTWLAGDDGAGTYEFTLQL